MHTDELNNLLRKLSPIDKAKALQLHTIHTLTDQPQEKTEIETLIRLLTHHSANLDHTEQIRLPPRDNNLNGKIILGTALYPNQGYGTFGLKPKELTQHVLIVGMTGSGKTNLAIQILSQLAKHKIPFLVFDWKGSYRNITKFPELRKTTFMRITDSSDQFRFNPLVPPPGINPKHWLGLLVDTINHSFFLGHGVEYFLRGAIDQLYGSFGIYRGGKVYPTFQDVENLLRKEFVKGREMLWMASAKRALAILNFPELLGKTTDTRTATNISELLNGQTILELDLLATAEKVFLVEALLLWLYEYQKSQGSYSELAHVILIEEAHHILSGKKETVQGEETVIESMLRMVREFGIGVVIIDQEPSKLSHSILANTSTKIAFNLGSSQDQQIIAKSMNLTFEESRFITLLKIGHAIATIIPRVPRAIHLSVPHKSPSFSLPS